MPETGLVTTAVGPLMAGRRGLVLGVANERSLAWGVARAVAAHGAHLAFTYQGEALLKRVRPLAERAGSDIVLPCDVAEEGALDATVDQAAERLGGLDFLVHAIAFSDKTELTGRYVDTTRANFLRTLEISCYSLTEATRAAARHLGPGGSVLTLSYIGAERVVPHYNVMGVAKAALEASVRYLAVDLGETQVRINAISAGPMRTLAASGIGDFRYILKWNEYNSPLKRNTDQDDIGGAALFLLSDLGRGTTGEIVHVDSGYHVVGMKAVDAPDIATV